MSTSLILSPIEFAVDTLDAANKRVSECATARDRLIDRQRSLAADLAAADAAAVRAAATPDADDDASAFQTLADIRTRASATDAALAGAEAALVAAEQRVTAATNALAAARADEALRAAADVVSDFDAALSRLISSVHAIDAKVSEARAYRNAAGMPLTINLVIPRRIRHALQAAGINVADDGPRADVSAARATMDALDAARAA